MNNPQCERCMLYLEHQIMEGAFGEWCGFDRERAMEDINYLQGVHDAVEKGLRALEEK